MKMIEKEARNRAMRAQHAARRLREAADMERRARDAAMARAMEHSQNAERHEQIALSHDSAARMKDAEQAEWETLLPAATNAQAQGEMPRVGIDELKAKKSKLIAELADLEQVIWRAKTPSVGRD